jgi:hypothetical protein
MLKIMFFTDVSGEVETVRHLMNVATAAFEALVWRLLADRPKRIDLGDLLSLLLTAPDSETGRPYERLLVQAINCAQGSTTARAIRTGTMANFCV